MLDAFLTKLKEQPEEITFDETMAVIEANFSFTPTAFTNGDTRNEAGQNSGSCKLFSFAQHCQLSEAETLQCFGDYYRKDVMENPTGNDHQNIRNFMKSGWQGIRFDGNALAAK